MRRLAFLPAVLMAAGLAATTGCKTAAVETKTWTKADALPFDVSLDGHPAVFDSTTAGPIKAVNGPVGVVQEPVAGDGAIKVVLPEGVKARSIMMEVVALGAGDKSAGNLSTMRKLDAAGEGKLPGISADTTYAMAVTVTPEKGAPMTSRVKFKTKPKA